MTTLAKNLCATRSAWPETLAEKTPQSLQHLPKLAVKRDG